MLIQLLHVRQIPRDMHGKCTFSAHNTEMHLYAAC
jgi:hypothetical protein